MDDELTGLLATGERAAFHGRPAAGVGPLQRAVELAHGTGREAEATAAAWLLGVCLGAGGLLRLGDGRARAARLGQPARGRSSAVLLPRRRHHGEHPPPARPARGRAGVGPAGPGPRGQRARGRVRRGARARGRRHRSRRRRRCGRAAGGGDRARDRPQRLVASAGPARLGARRARAADRAPAGRRRARRGRRRAGRELRRPPPRREGHPVHRRRRSWPAATWRARR